MSDTTPLPADPGEAAAQLTTIPPGYDRDRCHSCGAVIFWIDLQDQWGDPKINPRTGLRAKMPVNAGSSAKGTVRILGRGEGRVITAGEWVPDHERFVTHYATCPDRAQWRGQQRGGGGRR